VISILNLTYFLNLNSIGLLNAVPFNDSIKFFISNFKPGGRKEVPGMTQNFEITAFFHKIGGQFHQYFARHGTRVAILVIRLLVILNIEFLAKHCGLVSFSLAKKMFDKADARVRHF
jgi:hypothetical protein